MQAQWDVIDSACWLSQERVLPSDPEISNTANVNAWSLQGKTTNTGSAWQVTNHLQ